MKSDKSIGMIYAATREESYVAEAFMSAHSAKDLMPDLSITLYTDLMNSVYAKADCFDNVVPVSTRRSYKSLWAEGQLDRIKSLQRTPYDYTLQLDTDTRVMTSQVSDLIDKLEGIDIAMAICQPDVSYCSSRIGQPMFNVGLILYKKSEKMSKFLNAWEELTRTHFQLGNLDPVPEVECLSHIIDPEVRKRLLFMDQTSMVQLLSPVANKFDLDLDILHESWNYRGSTTGRVLDQPVKVDHRPNLRDKLAADIIQRSVRYMQSGNPEYARDILSSLRTHALKKEGHDILDQYIKASYQY